MAPTNSKEPGEDFFFVVGAAGAARRCARWEVCVVKPPDSVEKIL